MSKQYVYIFSCINCGDFYGEQSLTKDGRLLCPLCHGEQRVDSVYVERMKVPYIVTPYDPEDNL
jgi:hypothetical protein